MKFILLKCSNFCRPDSDEFVWCLVQHKETENSPGDEAQWTESWWLEDTAGCTANTTTQDW